MLNIFWMTPHYLKIYMYAYTHKSDGNNISTVDILIMKFLGLVGWWVMFFLPGLLNWVCYSTSITLKIIHVIGKISLLNQYNEWCMSSEDLPWAFRNTWSPEHMQAGLGRGWEFYLVGSSMYGILKEERGSFCQSWERQRRQGLGLQRAGQNE